MPNDHDVGHPLFAAAAASDDFKLVIFKIGNADFDMVACAWVRDLYLTGDAVE